MDELAQVLHDHEYCSGNDFPDDVLTLENMLEQLKTKARDIYEWVRKVVPLKSYRKHRGELRKQMVDARLAEACVHIMGLARVHSTHVGSNWALVETLILMAHKAPQALHEFNRRKRVAIDKKSAQAFLDKKELIYLRQLSKMERNASPYHSWILYLDNLVKKKAMRFEGENRGSDLLKGTVSGKIDPPSQHENGKH